MHPRNAFVVIDHVPLSVVTGGVAGGQIGSGEITDTPSRAYDRCRRMVEGTKGTTPDDVQRFCGNPPTH